MPIPEEVKGQHKLYLHQKPMSAFFYRIFTLVTANAQLMTNASLNVMISAGTHTKRKYQITKGRRRHFGLRLPNTDCIALASWQICLHM